MDIAIGIVRLFASGGLQRDCLALHDLLHRRGHRVRLFTAACEVSDRAGQTVVLPVRSLTNHGRDRRFGTAFAAATRTGFDLRVGFNILPGLDVLYCADRLVGSRRLPFWRRWLPRYRSRLALERACFAPDAVTHVLMLSQAAAAAARTEWNTPPARLSVLPPTIAADRIQPRLRAGAERERQRAALGLQESDLALLWIATQPNTKGLDRALAALAAFPDMRLAIAGLDAHERRSSRYVRMAAAPGLADRVRWLGRRDDIPALMAAADILLHPARYDTTGQVILEALCNGLPVLTTAACGFAEHVSAAGAGIVLPEPFAPTALAAALLQARAAGQRATWGRNALLYCEGRDFTRGFADAAAIIERVAAERRAAPAR